MTPPGETIGEGAPPRCEDCGRMPGEVIVELAVGDRVQQRALGVDVS